MADAVRIVGISKAAIRKYCGAFPDHVSAGANPNFGAPRRFTVDDLKLFHYVRSRTAGGLGIASVGETLPDALREYDWELPESEQPRDETVAISKAQIERYEDRMIEAQNNIEKQQGQIDDLTKENIDLIAENGFLRGQNEILKQERRGFWGRIFGG